MKKEIIASPRELFLIAFIKELIDNCISEETKKEIQEEASREQSLEIKQQFKLLQPRRVLPSMPPFIRPPSNSSQPIQIKKPELSPDQKPWAQVPQPQQYSYMQQQNSNYPMQLQQPMGQTDQQQIDNFSQFQRSMGSPDLPQDSNIQVSPFVNPASVVYTADSGKPKTGNPENFNILNLNRLQALLRDPNIISVECPGPDKPLIINRRGRPQPVNLILSTDEISQVMKEVSEKTKIPIVSGVFKAALGNLLVTAVISDFVGTRFVIQKFGMQRNS